METQTQRQRWLWGSLQIASIIGSGINGNLRAKEVASEEVLSLLLLEVELMETWVEVTPVIVHL